MSYIWIYVTKAKGALSKFILLILLSLDSYNFEWHRCILRQILSTATSFCKHVRMKMITPRRYDRKLYPQWEVTVFIHQTTANSGHSGANYLLAERAMVLPCRMGFKTWPPNAPGARPLRGVSVPAPRTPGLCHRLPSRVQRKCTAPVPGPGLKKMAVSTSYILEHSFSKETRERNRKLVRLASHLKSLHPLI